jgi:hypothetical protein
MSLLCFPRHSWSKRKEDGALGGGAKMHLIALSTFDQLDFEEWFEEWLRKLHEGFRMQ